MRVILPLTTDISTGVGPLKPSTSLARSVVLTFSVSAAATALPGRPAVMRQKLASTLSTISVVKNWAADWNTANAVKSISASVMIRYFIFPIVNMQQI